MGAVVWVLSEDGLLAGVEGEGGSSGEAFQERGEGHGGVGGVAGGGGRGRLSFFFFSLPRRSGLGWKERGGRRWWAFLFFGGLRMVLGFAWDMVHAGNGIRRQYV